MTVMMRRTGEIKGIIGDVRSPDLSSCSRWFSLFFFEGEVVALYIFKSKKFSSIISFFWMAFLVRQLLVVIWILSSTETDTTVSVFGATGRHAISPLKSK